MAKKGEMLENAYVAIEDGNIVQVGQGESDTGWVADRVIDGAGVVCMPGLVNTHTHAAMSLLRSYADDLPLMEWLQEKIWPLEAKLTTDHVYNGTKLAALEMIKSGTTCFADQYFFMSDVGKAVEEAGMRAVLARGMIGLNQNADLALAESEEFITEWNGAAKGRITAVMGPHAPYTCPPPYMEKVLKLAEKLNVGIHIHLAETKSEVNQIRDEYQKTPIELVSDQGVLDFPTIAAHCVHLTDSDIDILKAKNVGVAHNPESNMKLASGIAPINKLLQAGINVGIGTDGAASNNNLDMIEEMRSAALLQKVATEDPTVMDAYQVLQMATVGGAKVLNLDDKIGTVEVGKRADLILIDLNKPHLQPKHKVYANIVYAAIASDVDTVIVDGEVVMESREVKTLDEAEVIEGANSAVKELVD